jgi:hypothetical protein
MDAMPLEQVVGMARNGWSASIGIAGRHGPDYAEGGPDMDWEDYRRVYHNFALSMYQTAILNTLAGEALRDFPDGLAHNSYADASQLWHQFLLAASLALGPGPETTDLLARLRELAEQDKGITLRKMFGSIPEANTGLEESQLSELSTLRALVEEEVDSSAHSQETAPQQDIKDVGSAEATSPLSEHIFLMRLAMFGLGIELDDLDFKNLLHAQQLVMIFAHLDAFMADTLRTICQVRPDVLKSQRKVEWETILNCGDWDQVVAFLTDQYIFEHGWGPLRRRIQALSKELGLEVRVPETDLEFLDSLEHLRNVIVHNGGKASREYLEKTASDLEIGDMVSVDPALIDQTFQQALLLGGEICAAVAAKFFSIPDSQITMVDRYGRAES